MFWKSIYRPPESKVSLQFECCCFDHTTNFPLPITQLQLCRSGTRHGAFSVISVGPMSGPPLPIKFLAAVISSLTAPSSC